MQMILEFLFSLAMFINAVLFVPQIIKIIREKAAQNVSLLTFGGFNLIQLITLIHGVIHHDWYLVGGMTLSLITCGAVTVLIIYYQGKQAFVNLFRHS